MYIEDIHAFDIYFLIYTFYCKTFLPSAKRNFYIPKNEVSCMINMIRTFFENGGFYLIVIMRLLLACILGGLIGYER